MDTPVDSTATSWFPRLYIFHFRIPGKVFVASFPRTGSTCQNILIFDDTSFSRNPINLRWSRLVVLTFHCFAFKYHHRHRCNTSDSHPGDIRSKSVPGKTYLKFTRLPVPTERDGTVSHSPHISSCVITPSELLRQLETNGLTAIFFVLNIEVLHLRPIATFTI
jgi:hypothetical protein